jgi:Ca-activated chloride channel family protein
MSPLSRRSALRSRRRGTRARRAVLAVALLALAPAAVARAQDNAKPAVGGGSFNDAPLLAPGPYHDTIRPGERLFYAVALKPGQRLHVRANVPGPGFALPGAAIFAVHIGTPLREKDTAEPQDIAGAGTFVQRTGRQMEFATAPAGTFADTAEAFGGPYRGPGVWFVSFDLKSFAATPAPIEVPVDFDIAVEGTPQPEPRADRTPAPASSPTAAPAQQESRSGSSGTGLVIAGLAGLLAGLALAAVSSWRSSRRRIA